MNRKECIDKIFKLIPSEAVRHSIFMGDEQDLDEFLCSSSTILVYFSNLLNIAFLFIYARYKKWKEVDNVCDNGTPNNFVRVFSELEKVYKESSLSFNIIENLLIDIQLDISLSGSIVSELRLTNKILKNDNFPKYAYIAKKVRNSSRFENDIPLQERYEELVDLISTFPFLRDLDYSKLPIENAYIIEGDDKVATKGLYNIALNYDNDFLLEEKEFNQNLDTNYSLVCYGDSYYFLERIETYIENDDSSNRILKLVYWEIGSFNHSLTIYISSGNAPIKNVSGDSLLIQYETAFEDYACSILTFDYSDDEQDEMFRIKNFYNINYKYIKHLASTISDVLNANAKKELIKLYKDKYSLKGEEVGVSIISNDKCIHYTWYEIISVFMIEEGCTNVLANLFRIDHDIKNKILTNLEFRFGKSFFDKSLVEEKIENAISSFMNNRQNIASVYELHHVTSTKELERQLAEISARKIIIAVSKAANGNDLKEYKPCFPISIRSKQMLIEEIIASDFDVKEKYSSICQIFSETIKTLLYFYEGFFAYASVKKEFDNESFFRSLSSKEIENFQKSANKAFKSKVKIAKHNINKINNNETLKLITVLKNFCLDIESNKDKQNKQQYLKDFLGKNKIMDVQMLDHIYRVFEYEIIDEEYFDEFVLNVKKFFTYLKTGKSRYSSTSLGVIFPYVSTCEYTDISRDGNEVYHFSILSLKGQEKILRVLSEFTYNLSEKYYLLPNKLCSDDRLNLWIEPIIISYNNFNFEEEDE